MRSHLHREGSRTGRTWSSLAPAIAATAMMTSLVLVAPLLGGVPALRAAWQLVQTLKEHPVGLSALLVLHLAYGAGAGALFSHHARPPTIAKGVLWGLTLWGIAVTIYAPIAGLGFLTARAPAIAVLSLPPHLLYGIVLGAFATRGEITQPIVDRVPAQDLRLAA